jgi:hypothetical protein
VQDQTGDSKEVSVKGSLLHQPARQACEIQIKVSRAQRQAKAANMQKHLPCGIRCRIHSKPAVQNGTTESPRLQEATLGWPTLQSAAVGSRLPELLPVQSLGLLGTLQSLEVLAVFVHIERRSGSP